MDSLVNYLVQFLVIAPALIISVTIHEFMHGYVSDKLGDPTPRNAGRLTLNPLKHLDPMGTIMILIVRFGWGKPMPIDPNYYKNPRMGMAYSAMAGPLSNFALAFLVGYYIRIAGIQPDSIISAMIIYTAIISVFLGVFNLIPIPPLDGSKILAAFLPKSLLKTYNSLESYGILIIFLGFYFLGAGKYIAPLASSVSRLLGVPYL